jgi:hypothetical protein
VAQPISAGDVTPALFAVDDRHEVLVELKASYYKSGSNVQGKAV